MDQNPTNDPTTLPPPAPGLSDNLAGALAYVTIIPAIVFLVLAPYNRVPFIRFHSIQSIALFLTSVVLHFLLGLIPIVGWILLPLLSLALLVVWIVTVYKAYKGEWFKLPVIGEIAMTHSRNAY
jgi:uncharacterized membrane protein